MPKSDLSIPSVTIGSQEYKPELDKPEENILKIIKEPSDDATLRIKSIAVKDIGSAYKFAEDYLLPTMYAAGGIGIASVQVGLPIKLFIVDIPTKSVYKEGTETVLRNPQIYANAEIIKTSEDKVILEEGCLSVPQAFVAENFKGNALVERPVSITVRFQDIEGVWREKFIDGAKDTASQWESRCWQHEYDHTQGVLFTDKLYEQELSGVVSDE